MNFWEFLLWFCIAYFVYKIMTSGTVDKHELKRVLIDNLRRAFVPPLDEIIEAIDSGDLARARRRAAKLRDDVINQK